MTKSEGIELVQRVLWAVQKARSDIMEVTDSAAGDASNGGLTNRQKEISTQIDKDLFPHLFGEKGERYFLAIQKMAEKGEDLEPIDIYNLCYFSVRLEPVIALVATASNINIPDANTSLLHWTK